MTIEQKLMNFNKEIPLVSDYMEQRILEKIGKLTPKKIKYPKFKLRYAALITIFIAILSIGVVLLLNNSGTATGGLSDGYTVGGGAPELFPGYVGLKMEKTEYELSTPVPVTFNYGQFYYGNQEEEILDHTITVYVANHFRTDIDEPFTYFNPLYQLIFENMHFLDEQYTILNERPLKWGSSIQYQKEFSLDIDFNSIPLDKGVITIEISRKMVMHDETGNYEYTHIKLSSLYFLKEGDSIKFDWRQMPYWWEID